MSEAPFFFFSCLFFLTLFSLYHSIWVISIFYSLILPSSPSILLFSPFIYTLLQSSCSLVWNFQFCSSLHLLLLDETLFHLFQACLRLVIKVFLYDCIKIFFSNSNISNILFLVSIDWLFWSFQDLPGPLYDEWFFYWNLDILCIMLWDSGSYLNLF